MKRIAVSTIAAVFLLLGLTSTASAHRLSTDVARAAATDVARTVYLLQGNVDEFEVGVCRRQAAHRVRCRTSVVDNFVSWCGWWTNVSYPNHRARRINVELTDYRCEYDDDNEEYWER